MAIEKNGQLLVLSMTIIRDERILNTYLVFASQASFDRGDSHIGTYSNTLLKGTIASDAKTAFAAVDSHIDTEVVKDRSFSNAQIKSVDVSARTAAIAATAAQAAQAGGRLRP